METKSIKRMENTCFLTLKDKNLLSCYQIYIFLQVNRFCLNYSHHIAAVVIFRLGIVWTGRSISKAHRFRTAKLIKLKWL